MFLQLEKKEQADKREYNLKVLKEKEKKVHLLWQCCCVSLLNSKSYCRPHKNSEKVEQRSVHDVRFQAVI